MIRLPPRSTLTDTLCPDTTLFRSDPANPRARLAMAEIQLAFHNLGAAEKAFAALTQLPAVAAPAEQGLGITLLLKGQEEAALLALERATELDPAPWRAWNGIGLLHARAGPWDRSEERRGGKEWVSTG